MSGQRGSADACRRDGHDHTQATGTHALPRGSHTSTAKPDTFVGAQGAYPGYGWSSNGASPASAATSTASHSDALSAERDRRERQWLDILRQAMPATHGDAAVALAEWLRRAGHSHDWQQAARLAVDLLDGDSDQACDNLAVLLHDGWDGTLGGLLACARRM